MGMTLVVLAVFGAGVATGNTLAAWVSVALAWALWQIMAEGRRKQRRRRSGVN